MGELLLDKIMRVQQEVGELNRNSGSISVDRGEIHISSLDRLFELADDSGCIVTVSPFKGGYYIKKYYFKYRGVEFFVIR